MVTIKDIAKQAGVNYGTVSRALNNEPGVNEKTRAKIRAIADQLNYVPNLAARRMVARSTGSIGVIWPKLEGLFFYHLSQRLQQEASARGEQVMLSMVEPAEALRSFQEHLVDKVIHWSHTKPSENYLAAKRKFPGAVLEIGDWADARSACLQIDRAGAVHSAVRYLYDLGHRSIAFFGSHTQKYIGYERGMNDCGLACSDATVQNTKASDPHIGAKALRCLEAVQAKQVTAIIVDAQGTLFELARQARALQLRIPEQLSLVSYDDVPEMHQLLPVSITTVAPPIDALARLALDVILDPEGCQAGVYRMESVLTVRGSTSAPSKL